MRTKPKNFIIPLIIYPFDIMISLGETEAEFKRSLKKYNLGYEDDMKCESMGKFWMLLEGNQSVIRIHNFPKLTEDYATLQHEIFHAATFILDKIGVKFKLMVSDEPYAYLIGYITKQVYDKINGNYN